jgi:hypothetical protein
MTPEAKATITVDDKVVTIEGPSDFVERQLSRYIGKQSTSDTVINNAIGAASHDSKADPVLTEKQLVATKQPKGHPEIVAVLAFALAENGHVEFTEEDMRKAYIRASVKPPKVVGQAIRDAKNLCEYIETGKERGTYRLSNHGDRTVRFDMPRKKEA